MRSVLFIVLSILSGFCYADSISDTESRELRNSVEMIIKATLASDFETIINYTPQKLVNAVGGKKRMIAFMEESLKGLKSGELSIAEYSYEIPTEKLVTSTSEIILIPTKMIMKSSDVTVKSRSFLIASQSASNIGWRFVDASGIKSRKVMEFLFPEYPKNKEVPSAHHEIVE